MHAIVRVAGIQARVAPGERVRIPRTDAEVGSVVTLGDVLILSDGDDVTVGTPVVDGASVTAEVLGHRKADKVHVMKKKRRKRYRVYRGHRQQYTEVLITQITGQGGAPLAAEEEVAAPEPEQEAPVSEEASAVEEATDEAAETAAATEDSEEK